MQLTRDIIRTLLVMLLFSFRVLIIEFLPIHYLSPCTMHASTLWPDRIDLHLIVPGFGSQPAQIAQPSQLAQPACPTSQIKRLPEQVKGHCHNMLPQVATTKAQFQSICGGKRTSSPLTILSTFTFLPIKG